MITGRIPNRSGMTTVAFQGQGGGLPAAEWTYASVLKQGGVRVGKWKAVFNLRGDNGAMAGSDGPAAELGWRGPEKYAATVPAIYDLGQDPQERYDVFMNSSTEKTWTLVLFNPAISKLMKTYAFEPPRKLQSRMLLARHLPR